MSQKELGRFMKKVHLLMTEYGVGEGEVLFDQKRKLFRSATAFAIEIVSAVQSDPNNRNLSEFGDLIYPDKVHCVDHSWQSDIDQLLLEKRLREMLKL